MIDWKKVKYFKPTENWGTLDGKTCPPEEAIRHLNPLLVYCLDALRAFVGKPIIIHCAYRPNDPGSTHHKGDAVDFHIAGMPVVDQFLMTERTRLFAGIGVYPFWNNPGLHADVRQLRPNQHGPRWGLNAAGIYTALDSKFLRSAT